MPKQCVALYFYPYANYALEKAGIKEKIDHRTLALQEINRILTIHLGSAVTAMMKRGVATYKGARYLALESANQKIKSWELSLAAVEKEITAQSKRANAEYRNTAQLVRQELGSDITDPRLDLEVELRANSQSEIIKQSAVDHRLEEENPSLAKNYIKALAHVASTYKNLSGSHSTHKKIICHLIFLHNKQNEESEECSYIVSKFETMSW